MGRVCIKNKHAFGLRKQFASTQARGCKSSSGGDVLAHSEGGGCCAWVDAGSSKKGKRAANRSQRILVIRHRPFTDGFSLMSWMRMHVDECAGHLACRRDVRSVSNFGPALFILKPKSTLQAEVLGDSNAAPTN